MKNQRNLNALMLLTLADGQGTGASAWSDWKELLVWQLYHATTRYLADQESYYNLARIERAKLQESIREELPPDFSDEIETHFDFMPDTYFRGISERGGDPGHKTLPEFPRDCVLKDRIR